MIGCSIGKQGVYFNEMRLAPSLKLNNNILTVTTSNSNKNSALLIYEVLISVNQNKKQIYLSANQAVGKNYTESFAIKLTDYKITEPTTYSFYWIDPDNKITKLDIKK